MKTFKPYFFALAFITLGLSAQTQLVAWNFNTAGTYLQATTVGSNISGTPVMSYGTGVTNNGAQNVGSCSGTLTSETTSYGAALDLTDYVEFTLTPIANAAINISSFLLNGRGVGTAPTSYSLRSSDDSYATDLASGASVISTSGCTDVTMNISVSTTDAVTFRIYFYNAGNGTGRLNIDNFTVAGFSNLLPVQLISFTGTTKTSSNLLQWTVAKEENFSHYTVERSTDGRSYTAIGKIAGTGKSSYEFVDAKPNAKNLYRLQLVDKDGRQNATKVLMVANKPKVIIANIVPNLVGGNATLRVATEKPTIINLYANDISGRRIALGTHNLAGGEQQISLKLGTLAAGVYQLNIVTAAGDTETVRFVKQ